MKENIFLDKIINTLSNSEYLGDDCAYLKGLQITVSQDTLVEDVHFSMSYTDAYKLGYKSVAVNISDILASGAKPKYMTISLSLPKHITENFIEEFYRAVNDLSKKFDFSVIGGDITGSEKIVISICIIGDTTSRYISSRKNAKTGDLVIVTGEHGSSSYGFKQLKDGVKTSSFISEHLMPNIDDKFSKEISEKVSRYAMMDTSDGLADALFKIAHLSKVTIEADYNKIPHNKEIDKEYVLFGGEDYKLVAALGEKELSKISPNLYTVIGKVTEKQNCPLKIKCDNETIEIKDLEKTFNHFEET